MRSRMPMLASVAVAAAAAAVPQVAGAAPIHNHALSIHATPRHIVAGEPVLIYGRLSGRDSADQQIVLFHRIAGAKGFTEISRTTTNAAGQYEFARAEGVVNTDRSWYVRGPVHSHSKTIHEVVAGEVTLDQGSATGTTRHAVTFTGTVTGARPGARIRLQQQIGDGGSWHTLKTVSLNGRSDYSIAYAWRTAGERNVRVEYGGDAETTSAVSDPVSVVIQQRQAPYFTIGTSDAIVTPNVPTTISGTLDQVHTSTPEANTEVALYEYAPGRGPANPTYVASTTTSSTGAYSFTVPNTSSELYRVRTVNASPLQETSAVFQGVRDAVALTPSATTSTVGGSVSFSGTVAPADAGAAVYLEKLGRDGHWQVVGTSTVSSSSTFSFDWTFGYAGSKDFRAHVVGGPTVVGGVSPAVGISVAQPAITQLPSIG